MAEAEPAGLDEKLETLLIGVDTLFGGDALAKSGAHHVIADTLSSGMPLPTIYDDPFAQASRGFAQGMQGSRNVLGDTGAVDGFVRNYRLCELPGEIRELLTGLDEDEKANVLHLTDTLSVMLDTALAQLNKTELPSFDRRYTAAIAGTAREVKVANPADAREKLGEALDSIGFPAASDRDLRKAVLAWESKQGYLEAQKVGGVARKIVGELLVVLREGVFSHLDFGLAGHKADLSDLTFEGFEFKTLKSAPFTGSNTYYGGERGGVPLLRALVEYNTSHPITAAGLLSLCAHEVIGHYINAAVRDVLRRGGRLGFMAALDVMCSPVCTFQEGWAQNMFELMYGSREAAAERHGKDLLVALAHDDLTDIAKNNVAILYQKMGASLEDVRRHVAEDCAQADPFVKKLSGPWAQHPIIGPMYGPAYLVGRRIINAAIKNHGTVPVARIGCHLNGLVDIGTFQAKTGRLSEG